MIGTKRTKKVISRLLALAMVLTILPISAFAADETVVQVTVNEYVEPTKISIYSMNIEGTDPEQIENGLFNGTTESTFAPNGIITRAMMVTVLYRAEGEPEMRDAQWFEDVAKGQWYSDAVAWATFNGITVGYGDGNFGPDDYITREQIAVIMYRYAQYKEYDVTQGGMLVREFEDYEAISEYALSAMSWAVNSGLLNGREDNKLAPQDNATKAEIAAILHRFIEANK